MAVFVYLILIMCVCVCFLEGEYCIEAQLLITALVKHQKMGPLKGQKKK